MNKHILLIGGAGVIGVIALVVLMREKSSNTASAQALPQQAESPSSFPSYPAPPPLPPFTVNATPYYLTYNIAPDKAAAVDGKTDAAKDSGCGCSNGCKDSGTLALSQSFLKTASSNVRKAFQSGPNSGNLMAQFPPDRYPYLYQKGGTA